MHWISRSEDLIGSVFIWVPGRPGVEGGDGWWAWFFEQTRGGPQPSVPRIVLGGGDLVRGNRSRVGQLHTTLMDPEQNILLRDPQENNKKFMLGLDGEVLWDRGWADNRPHSWPSISRVRELMAMKNAAAVRVLLRRLNMPPERVMRTRGWDEHFVEHFESTEFSSVFLWLFAQPVSISLDMFCWGTMGRPGLRASGLPLSYLHLESSLVPKRTFGEIFSCQMEFWIFCNSSVACLLIPTFNLNNKQLSN